MSFCVGVLALQGGFIEHIQAIQGLNFSAIAVRNAADVAKCDAFILPGGESTVMAHLLKVDGLDCALQSAYDAGAAFWGTCAGAILCAKRCNPEVKNVFGWVDVVVQRNAYGHQSESSVVEVHCARTQKALGPAVLIRAPHFETLGANVTAVAVGPNNHVLAIVQDRCLLSSFHPELSLGQGFDWHAWFIKVAKHTKKFTDVPLL